MNSTALQKHDDKQLDKTMTYRIKPLVDIYEHKDDINLAIDMPAVKQEDLHVEVNDGQLQIIGKRCKPLYVGNKNGKDICYVYERAFSISNNIDAEKIDAKLSNGVLNLTLPIKESAKPKKINVKVK